MTITTGSCPDGLSTWAADELIQMGPLTVRIVSDIPGFSVFNYFSRAVRTEISPAGSEPPRRPDAELWCVSRAEPPLGWKPDRTTRAKGFISGYYVTDHFGPPVKVATYGHKTVLFGPRLEALVWPYFVKHLLLQHTVRTGGLFLKSAAFSLGGEGTLVLGRGGGGKTVLLAECCRRGAGFVTNSHAIVTGGSLQGVASVMRMRPGPWVDELGVPTGSALDQAELVVDPFDAFGTAPRSVIPRNLLVIDYRGPREHRIEELSGDEALAILEQFGLGLNVYRLEEDLLDGLNGDYRAFSTAYREMNGRLRSLVARCKAYYVVTDVRRPANRELLFEMLGP